MTTNPDLSGAEWVKSSYSGNGGANCVEWAPAHLASDQVPVRDSKAPSGPALVFPANGWNDFIHALTNEQLRG